MTFSEAFLEVKEKFDNADASATEDFAIQVTLTDEDCGGTFYAEVKEGKLAVEPYDYYDNNVVLDITKSALLAILEGESSLDAVVESGEAEVKGDASKIADWKSLAVKKTVKKAAKKTVKKEEPVEKAETVAETVEKEETTEKAKTVKTAAKTTAKKTTKKS